MRAKLELETVIAAEGDLRRDPASPSVRLRLAQACEDNHDAVGVVLALAPLVGETTDPKIAARLAAAYVTVGWLEEAERALARVPLNPAGVRLQLAQAWVRHGAAGKANALLDTLGKQPLSADDRLVGAAILLRCRRADEATAWARRAMVLVPEYAPARLLAVRGLLAAGRAEQALALLPVPPAGAAPDPDAEYWRGRVELRSPKPAVRKAGMQRLVQVCADQPQNAVAAFEGGRALLYAGDAAGSIPLLSRALEQGYQPLLCFRLLAKAYAAAQREREAAWARGKEAMLVHAWPRASAAFLQSLAADRTKPAAFVELSRAYSAGGKLWDALKAVEGALKISPQDVEASLLKAAVLGRLERIPEEEKQLEAAAAIAGTRGNEPLGNLGRIYYDSQQFDRAIGTLERALKIDGGDAFSHLYLGLTYARRTEDPRHAALAVEHLLFAAQRQPDNFYPWVNAGSVLQGMKALPEAAACYRRALDGEVRYDGAYLSLALTLQRLGRTAENALMMRLYARTRSTDRTRQELENGAKTHPGDAVAHFRLGDRKLLDGRPKEALGELLVSAALDPSRKETQARIADVCAVLDFDDLLEEAARAAR